jgi:hypothetical protein
MGQGVGLGWGAIKKKQMTHKERYGADHNVEHQNPRNICTVIRKG